MTPRPRGTPLEVTLAPMFDREVPNDPRAEMALLGSVLIDPNKLPEIRGLGVTPEVFYTERHAGIFDAILWVVATTGTLDLVQVAARLEARENLVRFGGTDYLVELASSVPFAGLADKYAGVVLERYRRRKLIEQCGQVVWSAYHDDDLSQCLSRASDALAKAATFGTAQREVRLGDAAREVMRMIDAKDSGQFPIGVPEFDEAFGGIYKRGINTFVGIPGSGKTSLAAQAALNIARLGERVRVFSYEMDAVALAGNLLANRAEQPVMSVLRRGGTFTDAGHAKIAASLTEFDGLDLEFVEDSMTASQIYERCALYAAKGVRCVVIDYIQSLPSEGPNDEQRINNAMAVIQRIHRNLDMCVILVSQVTASAARIDAHPRLSDGMGGQAIFGASTMGIGTYRPCLFTPRKAEETDEEWNKRSRYAELHVTKNKHGPIGAVPVQFEGAWTKFRSPLDGRPNPVGGAPDRRTPGGVPY